MPVDPNDIHGTRRQNNPLLQRHLAQARLLKRAKRQGALTLATVPAERTVADAFRVMLETSERNNWMEGDATLVPGHGRALYDAVVAARADDAPAALAPPTSRFYALALDPARTTATCDVDGLTVRDVDAVWSLLERTALNAPVHGMLALRGKALVETTVAELAYADYPRLRSRHLQRLLHASCGLLPCAEVGRRLGFAQVTGVEAEIGMWRELNVLTERLRTARVRAAAHLQRIEHGVAAQRRWYWRAVSHSARDRLRLFPVHVDDLQPRLEWVRDSVFAFVAFVEMAEGATRVGALVRHLFCAPLARAARMRRLVQDAEQLLARHDAACASAAMATLAAELQTVRRRTRDEEAVAGAETHPLHHRAALRRAAEESSGGPHATQPLTDDLFLDYHAPRHGHQAPAIIVDALGTTNAFKETQLILRYAPHVNPAVRDAPIDVDQVVRKVIEVHETNAYAPTYDAQQYRQVEYTVCRLYAGAHCLGEGKGETLMESMQTASQHMVNNYYLHGSAAAADDVAKATSPPQVRLRAPRTEEEIVF